VHWRRQVAISTALRRGVARDKGSICEKRDDCVRANGIFVLARGALNAPRPLHVIASEAKQSTHRRKERMDCFAFLAMAAGRRSHKSMRVL
jgi:hypothetical protein